MFQKLIAVTALSKGYVCGRLLAGIEGLNASGGMESVPCECVVSGRGLCDGPIARPEQSHQLCVMECDQALQ